MVIHIPAMRDAQAGSVVARVFTCSLFEDTLSMRDCVRQSPTKRQENLKALRIHADLFLRFQSVNHTSQKTGGDLIRSPLIEILRTLKLGRTQSSAARRTRQKVYLLSAIILLLAADASAGSLISDLPIENRDAMGAFYSSLRLTESGEAITFMDWAEPASPRLQASEPASAQLKKAKSVAAFQLSISTFCDNPAAASSISKSMEFFASASLRRAIKQSPLFIASKRKKARTCSPS